MKTPQKILSIIAFSALFFFSGAGGAFAKVYSLSGYGWAADNNIDQGFCVKAGSPNPQGKPLCVANGLGYISFSNKTDGTAIPYGVNFNGETGEISGYAWIGNGGGWITFNNSEMATCKNTPGDCPPDPYTGVADSNPKAYLNLRTDSNGSVVSGDGRASGWARDCRVFVSGCRGALRPVADRGGWDGWISLGGSNYGLEYDISSQQFKGPANAVFPTMPNCTRCYAWMGGNVSDGNGWGMNALGLSIDFTPSVEGPLLSFYATPASVVSGGSATLVWTPQNVNSCTASSNPVKNNWNGAKSATYIQHTQLTGVLTADQTYYLQCRDSSGNLTPMREATITIAADVVGENGQCGTANARSSRSEPSVTELCSVGLLLTPPGVQKNTSTWDWTCSGLNGGTNATCSAPLKKGFKWIEF